MASNSDVLMSQAAYDPEREFVLSLISFYRENPVLWDPKNEHYTNKYRRQLALNIICNALKAYKPKYTIEALKKKLNILRTNFNKERNNIEKRKFIYPEEEPRPTLWYYNDMAFLIGQEVPAERVVAVHTSKPPSPELISSIKRKKMSVFSDSSNFRGLENEADILAKCWAMKLRKLAPDQRLYAEKIINDTLFEAEMGTLTRHGVAFNTDPSTWVQYSSESETGSPDYKCS